MPTIAPKSLLAPALLLLSLAGCGGSDAPSNLSPTPEQDPARHERAVKEDEERARKNLEAEKKAMSRKHIPNPEG